MDEYLFREEYYKSVRGEDGEEPLEALGSPPSTDTGSFLYSGPGTDLADTVSLPRQPRGPASRPGTLKCGQFMWRIPISQGGLMVPWTVRPNYCPNYCLGLKMQM